MTTAQVKAIRDRAWGYMTPEVAASAGLTLTELQQFCAAVSPNVPGGFVPSEEQLIALARRMSLSIKEPAI